MTKFQASMFQKHSPKIVCVDSTHKTNPYGFKLVTVVVPNEFKNGKKLFDFMKWSLHNVHNIHRNSCLMGREDIPTLEAFFKCIQGKVAIVNTLMTDDGIYALESVRLHVCITVTSYRPGSTCGI